MFKELKVWLLTGNNNDRIVIKNDAVQQGQYKSASPIVKAIAPAAKSKVLSPGELFALQQYVARYEQMNSAYSDFGMVYRPQDAKAVSDLKQSLTNVAYGFPFVKMAYVQQTNLEEALESRLGPNADKTDLRAFTDTLNAPGGFERLGKIIAADMFNGNTDRFFPGSASTKTIAGTAFNLRCLVNVGNVFRVVNAGGSEVGALDFNDPNSISKNINMPLAQAEPAYGPWPGRILADHARRKEFAKDVIHDLEAILSPHKSRFSLKTKLKSDAPSRLVDGMVQGAYLIRNKLELKYNPHGWTPGISDRYTIICQVVR